MLSRELPLCKEIRQGHSDDNRKSRVCEFNDYIRTVCHASQDQEPDSISLSNRMCAESTVDILKICGD